VADGYSDILCAVNTVENPCQMTPYVNITLLKDLTRPYLQVIGKNTKLDRVVLDQTINVCRMTNSSGLIIAIKLLLDIIKDKINFQITCPFKKVVGATLFYEQFESLFIETSNFQGYYEFRSIPNKNGLLLNLLPVNQTLHFSFRVKSRVDKTIETIFSYELDVSIMEVDD
jgi:hypothetical protein